MFYRQCELKHNDTIQVAWIPEELARIGLPVWCDPNKGEIWKITFVSESRKSYEECLAHERDHMYHRDRTDI